MAVKVTIIGNGTNRLIAVSAGSALVNLFTLDLVTGVVTSGADSAGNPFFTTAEVANLSTVLKQIIAAAAESSATPTATTVANLITQLAALDGNTYPVTTSLLSGTNYQVVVTPSAVPAVFTVQKPYSTYGSMGFGGGVASNVIGRPPNYINGSNPGALGPAATVSFTSAPITRQASGVVYVDGSSSGTQSVQSSVTQTVYRDYGLPGQVQLVQQVSTPGSVGGTNYWAGDLTWIDVLPDSLPHTYAIVVAGSGGSNLSVPIGSADIQAYELGSPS